MSLNNEKSLGYEGFAIVAKAIAFLGLCLLYSPVSQWSNSNEIAGNMKKIFEEKF